MWIRWDIYDLIEVGLGYYFLSRMRRLDLQKPYQYLLTKIDFLDA